MHDRDRPLHSRGRKDAGRIGEFLTRLDQVPDAILASPAVRAAETARLATESGGWQAVVEISEDLYDTPPWKVLRLMRALPNGRHRALLVFHEPTCSETLSDLVGHVSVKMPPGTLARVDLNVEDWDEVEPGAGTLGWLVTPRILRAG